MLGDNTYNIFPPNFTSNEPYMASVVQNPYFNIKNCNFSMFKVS